MTESLRVAFLSSDHPSVAARGLAHTISRLGRCMVRDGHEVDVYYPVPGTWLPPVDELEGVRAIPVGWTNRAHIPFGPDLAFSRHVARGLPGDRDVVVAHNETGGAPLMRRVRRARHGRSSRGPIAVQTFHGVALRFLEVGRSRRPRGIRPQLGYYPDWLALRTLEGGAARAADGCIACSKAVAAEVRSLYEVPAERVHVIYNGVEPQPAPTLEERAAARRSIGLEDGTTALAFVGEDTYRKGLDVAVRTVELLRSRGRRATLVNLGNGLPSSDFVLSFGVVDDTVKRRLLVASDLFFLPTRYEGLPAVVQEAAALRLPVVTTPAANVEWGEPGRDFVLFEPNTPEAAVEALLPLLDSEDSRRALGERGFHELGSRGYEEQAREYLDLFRDLISRATTE